LKTQALWLLLERLSVRVIVEIIIYQLIISLETYRNHQSGKKTMFYSHVQPHPDPGVMGTGSNRWILSRISRNKDRDTRTSASWNVT